MNRVTQDLRYAIRLIARAPGFAAVVVLTLALGIGANTAIFSVVSALLLRPLPYPEADRLVVVYQDMTARGGPAREWTTPGNFVDLAAERALFSGVTSVRGWQPTLTGMGDPEPLLGEQVTAEYFGVLGVGPTLGRAFTADEDLPGAARVAILSHDLWVRRFASDPRIVGRRVMLGGEAHELIGVMPQGFRPAILTDAEIWRPARLNRAAPSRGAVVLRTVARLAPGLGVPRGQVTATAIAARLEAAYPDYNRGVSFALQPLHEQAFGDIRSSLLVLLAAVGFVLVIACANVANLLLARASGRSREMAVRFALGAGRGRVVQQLLTESLLLAALGGGLGVLVGLWGVSALTAVVPSDLVTLRSVRIDAQVLTFAALVTLATGVCFGLVPALQASRHPLGSVLKDSGRQTAGRDGQRVRRALVVAEIAIALILLVGSGLLLRTFLRLQAADLGFQPSGVLVGTVITPQTRYPNHPARVAFFDRLLERAASLPGVQSAALTSVIPLRGDSDVDVEIEGLAPRAPGDETTTWYRLVSANYLSTMGIPLRRGRAFTAGDPLPAVIVSETAARRFWPGADPIGRRVKVGSRNAPWQTVIGIAGDVSMRGARGEALVEMYVPYWQSSEGATTIVVKTGGNPESLAAGVRSAVKALDPDMPVANLEPMDRVVQESIAQPRFLAVLISVFAVLSIALAALGIYGVMSFAVTQRTAEIGVRMALGADRRSVFRLVAADGVRLALLGIALGVAGSLVVGRSLTTLLYAVTPADPAVIALTAAGLFVVALGATMIPARRATRVEPLSAIRE